MEVRKRRYTPFFIFSLFLHVILLILFGLYSFTKKPIILANKKSLLSELPASMKPRAGTLDHSVFFDFSPPNQEATKEQIVKGSANVPEQQKHTDTEEKEKITSGETPVNKPKETETKIEKKEDEKKIDHEELKKLALQNLLKEVPRKEASQPVKSTNELIASKLSKPSPTHQARIPMGVPGISKSLGLDLAQRSGDDSKKPSLEELKYVCYLRKIAKCLYDDLKNIVHTFNSRQSGKVEILFEIGEKGNLNAIEIATTSQKQLEQILVQIIKANAPFPPIPKYFEKNFFFSKIELEYTINPNSRSMSGALYGFI